MYVFDKYKELRRAGEKVMEWTDKMNENTHLEIWKIDEHAFKVTKYCDCPYVIERVDINNYIPKFGGF